MDLVRIPEDVVGVCTGAFGESIRDPLGAEVNRGCGEKSGVSIRDDGGSGIWLGRSVGGCSRSGRYGSAGSKRCKHREDGADSEE